jgi:hypothetical protein
MLHEDRICKLRDRHVGVNVRRDELGSLLYSKEVQEFVCDSQNFQSKYRRCLVLGTRRLGKYVELFCQFGWIPVGRGYVRVSASCYSIYLTNGKNYFEDYSVVLLDFVGQETQLIFSTNVHRSTTPLHVTSFVDGSSKLSARRDYNEFLAGRSTGPYGKSQG